MTKGYAVDVVKRTLLEWAGEDEDTHWVDELAHIIVNDLGAE